MSNHNKTMCDVYVHWMDGGEEKRAFVGSCNAVSKDVLCESLCAGGGPRVRGTALRGRGRVGG